MRPFSTIDDARTCIDDLIVNVYNRERLHSAQGCRPPLEFAITAITVRLRAITVTVHSIPPPFALQKQQITARVDADILVWLKADGRGYQTRLNTILRRAMQQERAHKVRTGG